MTVTLPIDKRGRAGDVEPLLADPRQRSDRIKASAQQHERLHSMSSFLSTLKTKPGVVISQDGADDYIIGEEATLTRRPVRSEVAA